MTVLVFDTETIPDLSAGKKLYNLDGLSDEDIAQAMFALRREKTGHEFLPHYLQKIIAISVLVTQNGSLKLWSLGDMDSDEKDLVTRFFAGIDKYTPTLVSWNGNGFDLPVLHYRALLHGVVAPSYWETGNGNQDFRWNNYLNRYHYRHLDLMDVLASYQSKAFAPLDDIATILGFPGKMGMNGAKVFAAYLAAELQSIRNYCETDVLNTYCVYLCFERMRGSLSQADYENAIAQVKTMLAAETDKTHWQEFLQKM